MNSLMMEKRVRLPAHTVSVDLRADDDGMAIIVIRYRGHEGEDRRPQLRLLKGGRARQRPGNTG